MAYLLAALASADSRYIKLNTGQLMPLVNLGGTYKDGHDSNFSEFLLQGGRGIDTALTYSDPQNKLITA